jgi:hypothetical protein
MEDMIIMQMKDVIIVMHSVDPRAAEAVRALLPTGHDDRMYVVLE